MEEWVLSLYASIWLGTHKQQAAESLVESQFHQPNTTIRQTQSKQQKKALYPFSSPAIKHCANGIIFPVPYEDAVVRVKHEVVSFEGAGKEIQIRQILRIIVEPSTTEEGRGGILVAPFELYDLVRPASS